MSQSSNLCTEDGTNIFLYIFFVTGHFPIPKCSVSADKEECLRRRKSKFPIQEFRFGKDKSAI